MAITTPTIVNELPIARSGPFAFNNDEDAIAFYRWWKEAGARDLFVKWAAKIDFDITVYSDGVLPDAK